MEGGACHILYSVTGWRADALEANSVMEEKEEEGVCLIMEEEMQGGGGGARDRERERHK